MITPDLPEQEQPRQLTLMDIPEEPALVEAVKSPINYGRLALRDQERVDQAAVLFAEGRGMKAVSRLLGMGHETSRAIRRALEDSGRLGTIKGRIQKVLGPAILDGVDEWHRALIDGRVKPESIPVAVGIFTDKHLVLSGEPSAIIEHRHDELSPRAIAAGLEAMLAGAPAVVEVEPPTPGALDYQQDYAPEPSPATDSQPEVST